MKRGKLYIIVSAAPGAGKTYKMLTEGTLLLEQGVSVVIGALDHHWPETLTLAQPFPRLEGNTNALAVEAIIDVNPDIVLVDQLAGHLADVERLLAANIGVITTVNISEIADVALELGTEAKLPSDILLRADEVKLLDISPRVIAERCQSYDTKTLHLLRELALRKLAEDVDDDLMQYRSKLGLEGPSGVQEKIMVAVQYNLNGSLLIRRAHQMAERLDCDFIVVAFVKRHATFSAEQLTFRRSFEQLVEKLGGVWCETVMEQSDIAEAMVSFAKRHDITRLLIGHSARSRLYEIRKGSIINYILRAAKHLDVYIIAPQQGEKPLVAKWRPQQNTLPGKLKIFIGAAPGVGKTYAMLKEANERYRNGHDVVVGLLETHGRAETAAQLGDLPIVPKRKIVYKHVELEEMDIAAILERKPELVLVDELAHTNVPTSLHLKRYEDVEWLLRAGIDVMTTVNVQHLESLNDIVEQITGVRVRETVPDHFLTLADEIELIDLSPKGLRDRMRSGKIYHRDKIEQSLHHFFKTVNLISLRELALREVAHNIEPLRTDQEAVAVCVHLKAHGEQLIRRGVRLASRIGAELVVIFVQHRALSDDEDKLLGKLKQLTWQLGGQFEHRFTERHTAIVPTIVATLDERQITRVVIGHSVHSRLQEWLRGSVVEKLLRRIRHVDVLVVRD